MRESGFEPFLFLDSFSITQDKHYSLIFTPPPLLLYPIKNHNQISDETHPHRRHPLGLSRVQSSRSRERDEPPGKAGL